jgi:hypothetical protein
MRFSRFRFSFFDATQKPTVMSRLARVLALVALTGPLKSLVAKAQSGPSCTLVPSVGVLHGELFDGDRCKCVKPGSSAPAAPCGLLPFFCELRGGTFKAKKCKCAPPRGSPHRETSRQRRSCVKVVRA